MRAHGKRFMGLVAAGDGHVDAFMLVDVFSCKITFLSKSSINLDRQIASNHNLSHL